MASSTGGARFRATIGARLVTLLVFALLGPLIGGPIGCSAFLGGVGLTNSGPGTLGAIPGALGLCLVYGPIFGFTLGFVPAAVTGASLALLGKGQSNGRRAVIISALVSAAYAWLLFADGDSEAGRDGTVLFAGVIVISGMAAGAVCWRVVEALLGRNAQSPPTSSAPLPSPPAS